MSKLTGLTALTPPTADSPRGIEQNRPMLTLSNVHAGYGKVEVLHGISLEVARGQVVTLIGSNGAGKTTTLRAVSGMVAPSAGQITLNGRPIAGLEPYSIAQRGLAHSPEGRRVFATMSVSDNLVLGAFPRLTGSRSRGDVQGDLERALELFPRLKERRKQLAGTLSGGEQQMLAMARAMMLNPDVVLLDEPSMGLAPILVEEVFKIISRLKHEGVTMLLVEQFAASALAVADYGYVLENGRISVHGPAHQLRNDPAVKAAYLGGSHGA
jgi:branched-chain amino acid transport system ATP-binding protein